MLIHIVHTKQHTCCTLFLYKRSLQPIGQSSFTLLGWFRLSSIDQYSSLLPPVGVSSNVGDLPLRTPIHRRFGGPLPRQLPNGTHPHLLSLLLIGFPCGIPILSGVNLTFARLSPNKRQVGYVLLTRAPVAIRVLLLKLYAAPRLACVKPVASVHPEPGSNSSL